MRILSNVAHIAARRVRAAVGPAHDGAEVVVVLRARVSDDQLRTQTIVFDVTKYLFFTYILRAVALVLSGT